MSRVHSRDPLMKILIDDRIPENRQFREAKLRACTCNR